MLFVIHLTILGRTQTIFHKVLRWIMNWKECGRKRSCPGLVWYFHMCLEEMRSHC